MQWGLILRGLLDVVQQALKLISGVYHRPIHIFHLWPPFLGKGIAPFVVVPMVQEMRGHFFDCTTKQLVYFQTLQPTHLGELYLFD